MADADSGRRARENRARENAENAEKVQGAQDSGGDPHGTGRRSGGEDPGTGTAHREPGSGGRGGAEGEERSAPSPLGRGDIHAVAGSDMQQPEIAAVPVEGMEPGEKVERGPWIPPVEVDAPEGDAVPRDAAGEPEAVRRQKEEGGP